MTGRAGLVADVAVVGAGPAGSATAIWCSLQGLRTVLLERATHPRERPGETLHPGVEPLLRQLGVLDAILSANLVRHEGHWIRWDGPATFAPYGADADGTWRGFQAPRAVLDRLLHKRAADLGVELRYGARSLRPLTAGVRVLGVDTADGPVHSTVTIDATGGNRWLGRHLRLAVERHSPRLIARYGYAASPDGAPPAPEDAPLLAADARGWTWTARVGHHRYHWMRLDLRSELLAGYLPPAALRGLLPSGPVRSADVTWRLLAPSAGLGYFVVGDAAATLDPASSHGVLRALVSGMQAAHLVARVRAGDAAEATVARAYRAWMRTWFAHDADVLRRLYRRLPDPPRWCVPNTMPAASPWLAPPREGRDAVGYGAHDPLGTTPGHRVQGIGSRASGWRGQPPPFTSPPR